MSAGAPLTVLKGFIVRNLRECVPCLGIHPNAVAMEMDVIYMPDNFLKELFKEVLYAESMLCDSACKL